MGAVACLTGWLPTHPTAGPVTNASIMLAPVSMLSPDFRPSLPLPHFNKHLLGAEHGDEQHRGALTLRLGLYQQVGPTAGSIPLGLCIVALYSFLVWFMARVFVQAPPGSST